MWIKLFESDFILFLLTPPQWFSHPPSLVPFAWLLSAIMEDPILRCSYNDTLHSLTRSCPISPASRHSSWPLPAQVILHCAFALMCPSSVPSLALKCLFVQQKIPVWKMCFILWLWCQCFHLSAPNLNSPTQSRNTKVHFWFCTKYCWVCFLFFFFFK